MSFSGEEVEVGSLNDGDEHFSHDSGDDNTSHVDNLVADIQADLVDNLTEVTDLHAEQQAEESVVIGDAHDELVSLEVDTYPEMIDNLTESLHDDNSVSIGEDSHDSHGEHDDSGGHDHDTDI